MHRRHAEQNPQRLHDLETDRARDRGRLVASRLLGHAWADVAQDSRRTDPRDVFMHRSVTDGVCAATHTYLFPFKASRIRDEQAVRAASLDDGCERVSARLRRGESGMRWSAHLRDEDRTR